MVRPSSELALIYTSKCQRGIHALSIKNSRGEEPTPSGTRTAHSSRLGFLAISSKSRVVPVGFLTSLSPCGGLYLLQHGLNPAQISLAATKLD